MTTIGIIGGKGRMGRATARFLEAQGHKVLISDRGTRLSNRALAKKADVVIVAVNIDVTEKVIEGIVPHLRSTSLLMDLTSVKERPMKAMLKSKAAVIGLHPMCNETTFGAGQTLLYCPARPKKWGKWVTDTFGKRGGFNLIKLTPKKHDEMMAIVQGLIHFSEISLAKTLHTLDPDLETILKLASPASNLQIKIAARHLAQDPNLYGNIQIQNQRNRELLKVHQESVNALADLVDRENLKAFNRYFNKGKRYFGEFGKGAVQETDGMIHRMMGETHTSDSQKSHPKNAVGTLGPALTFSALAAGQWGGRKKRPLAFFKTIRETVKAVAKGSIQTAVIPVENRLNGTVRETMDALFNEKVSIVGELGMPIHHCLATLKGVSKKSIQRVMSHPQALNQCRDYLNEHFPKAEWIATPSTAGAFERLKRYHDRHTAVIGPEAAAKAFNLKVVKKNIENDSSNETRFIVIERKPLRAVPKRNPKTSLIFYFSKNRPGSLFRVFEIFRELDINLSRIESRPAPKALGEYLFYLDFDDSVQSKRGKQAIAAIKQEVDGLKILGTYPKSS